MLDADFTHPCTNCDLFSAHNAMHHACDNANGFVSSNYVDSEYISSVSVRFVDHIVYD